VKVRNVPYVLGGHVKSRSVLLQLAFAAFGLSVGVALLFASQIASTTLTHSAAELNTTQLVGAAQVQLDSPGPEGFPETVLAAVRRAPGVLKTLPIVERPAGVIGRKGERSVDLIGVEPSALNTTIPLLRHFSTKFLNKARGLALPEPLVNEIEAGVTARLQVSGQVVTTLVGALLTSADIGSLIDSPIALTSIVYAQKLSHSGDRLTLPAERSSHQPPSARSARQPRTPRASPRRLRQDTVRRCSRTGE
jgi:putative ABC transport system permease protein